MIKTKIKINNIIMRKGFSFVLLISIFVSSFGFVTNTATAAIASTINFQGKLTKVSDGTNVANGTYAFEFKIYDALSSGSLLWTETYDQPSGACGKLTVTNGVFNAKLGSCNALTGIDFTTGSLYVSVNFAPTGTSYDGEMSPRKQLVAAPFAFNANNVVGDGRIDIAYAPGTTTNPGGKIDYSPSVSSSNNSLQVLAGSNVTGAAIKVTQAGSGVGIDLAGAGGSARVINSTSADITIQTTTSGNVVLNSAGGTIELQDATNITGNTGITGNLDVSGTLAVGTSDALTVSAAGTVTIATGQSYTGAGTVTFSSGTASALTINSGTTGTISIGDDASNETINVGTGAAVKTLVLGSTNSTSPTTVQSGSGNITLQSAGSGTTGNVYIGEASATPDLLIFGTKTTSGNPTAVEGAAYYNSNTGKFYVAEGSSPAWKEVCNKTDAACGAGSGSAWSALSNALGNLSLTNAEYTSSILWDTASTAAAKDYFTLSVTNDASTDSNTQRVLVIQNNDDAGSTGTTERLLVLDNADTNEAVTTALEIGSSGGGAVTTAIDASDSDIVTALNVGANDIVGTTGLINYTNFDVDAAGAVTAAGLITGTAGLTISGAATSINASSNFATNINTGSSNTLVSIGGGSGTFALDTTNIDISNTGAITNATGFNGLVVTANTGVVTTGTWQGTAVADTYVADTLTTNSSSSIDWLGLTNYPTACSAGSAVSTLADVPTCTAFNTDTSITLQDAYGQGNTISTSGSDIGFTLNSSNKFTVATAAGATGASEFTLTNGSNATPPAQLILIRNNDTTEALATGLKVTSAAGTITTAIDLTDTNIGDALNVGANDIVGTTGLINFTNFDVDAAGAVTAVGVNAGSGLLQGTGGLTLTGTAQINATGAGTTTIGNASAGAIALQSASTINLTAGGASTFSAVAGTAAAYRITDGTNPYIAIDTRTTTSAVAGVAIAHTAPTIASGASTFYNTASFTPGTVNFSGSTQITSTGTSANNAILFNQPTINRTAAASSLVIDQASNLFINGPTIASHATGGQTETITDSAALRIGPGSSLAGTNGVVTNGYGLYAEAPTGATNNYVATFKGGNIASGLTGGPTGVGINIDNGTNVGRIVHGDLGGGHGTLDIIPDVTNFSGVGLRVIPFNVLGTGDSFFQAITGASGYGIFENYGGLGTALSSPTSGTSILFTPNRTEAARFLGTGEFGIGTQSPDAKLEIAGNVSRAAWGLNGPQLQATAATYTDTSTAGAGTATNAAVNSIGQSSLAATNSITTTNAFGLYLAGAPISASNQTLTNTSALYIAAAATVDGAGGTPTNSYGLYANAQTGATNNYAAAFQGGNVGIGTASPATPLDVWGNIRNSVNSNDYLNINVDNAFASNKTQATFTLHSDQLASQSAFIFDTVNYGSLGTFKISNWQLNGVSKGYINSDGLLSAITLQASGGTVQSLSTPLTLLSSYGTTAGGTPSVLINSTNAHGVALQISDSSTPLVTILGVEGTVTNPGAVGIGTVSPGGLLDVDRPDASSITAEQISVRSSATSQTLTDGTTITNWRNNQFIAPTLNGVAAGGTETVTNAATLYVDAAPSGSNITITNPYALWVDSGTARFDGDVTVAGLLTGTLGATISGATISLNDSSNFAVNIGTGTSTGTVTIGGSATQTIAVGDGAGVKTVSLGSSNSSSTTTLLSGSGGLLLNKDNNQPTNINTGTSTAAVTIGSANTTGTLTFGQSTVSNTVLIASANPSSATQTVSIGNGVLGSSVTNTVNIANNDSNFSGSSISNNINIGRNNSSLVGTTNVNIGNGSSRVAVVNVNIANTDTAGSGDTVAIGNAGGASSLTLKAGTGNVAIQGATSTTYTLGTSTGTGTITIGNSTATNTISIGSGVVADTKTQTINIANAAANGTTSGGYTVNIAATDPSAANGTNAVTIGNSGTGPANIAIRGGTSGTIAIGSSAGTGDITLGSSSGTQSVLIGNGTGAATVSIANGATNAKTINIGTGAVANTITIGSASSTGVSITDNNWSITTGGVASFITGSVLGSQTFTTNNISDSGALTVNSTSGNLTLQTTTSGDVVFKPSSFIAKVGGGTSVTELRFLEPSGTGTDYAGFKAPADVTTSYTWSLPVADASGCIQSNGSGALSIGACGGGSQTPWTSDIDADNFSLLDFGPNLTARAGTTITATSADLALATATSGNITLAPASTGSVSITSGVTTGTTTTSGLVLSANSLSTGTGLYAASSSLTSGNLVDLQVSGTSAALSNQTALNILTAGSNNGSSRTTYGAQISNTHTGTSSTNIGLYLNASGGSNNYGLIVNAGFVGIGTTTPALFQGDGANILQLAGNGNPEFVLERTTGGSTAKASWRINANKDVELAVQDGAGTKIDALQVLSDTGIVNPEVGLMMDQNEFITFGATSGRPSLSYNSTDNALLIRSNNDAAILLDDNNDDSTAAFRIFQNVTTEAGGGTADLFTVDSSNSYVGIGDASPDFILDATKSSTNGNEGIYPEIRVTNPSATGGTGVFAGLSVEAGNSSPVVVKMLADFSALGNSTGSIQAGANGTKSNHPFIFYTNNSPRTIIDTSGNFGINDYTPTNKRLSVLNSGATTATQYGAYISNTATSSTASIDKYGLYVANSGTFGASTTNLYGLRVSSVATTNTPTNNYGLYVDAPTGASTNYGAIIAGGNVGIGDTTPAALFTVGSGDLFQVSSTGDTTITPGQSTTALTVGRTGTTYALQVDTSAASSVTGLKVTAAAAAGGVDLAVISSGANENLRINAKGSGALGINSTATGDVYLTGGGGSVSIGSGLASAGKLGIDNIGSSDNVVALSLSEGANNEEFSIRGMFGSTGSNGNAIKFYSGAFSTDNILYMRGDGRIGIGVNVGTTITSKPAIDIDLPDQSSLSTEEMVFRSNNTVQALSNGATITNMRANQFFAPTLNGIAGGGTETVTNAATLYVDAAPSGSNITITNPYALWVDSGTTRLDGTLNLSTITGSTQCLVADTNGNVSGTACGGGSLTPWTSAIDADGFALQDALNIEFRTAAGSAPAGSVIALYADNSGDLTANVLTGKTYNIAVNGTDEYNFSSSALAMNGNNITGLGTALTATAGLTITGTSADLALATATSGNITATTATTSGLFNILTGNLKVGNGSPGVSLNGDDAYITGTLEVDGSVQHDGAVTANSTSTFNGTSTFNTDADFTFAGTENIAVTNTTGSNAVDLLSLTLTNNDAGSATQRGIAVTNADSTSTTESLLFLDNADTTAASLTDGILITSSGVNNGITDAIDVSAANINNALNVGANTITGAGYTVQSTASGLTLTSASANLALTTTTSGNITLAPASTGSVAITSGVTSGTTTSAGLVLNANSLTSGTGFYAASSTLQGGKLVDLQVSGTAAAASQTGLNILTTGTNGTGGITTYGAQISNTHDGGTSTNVALYLNASGGTTANYALIANSGSVGIGTTAPTQKLTVSDGIILSNFGTDSTPTALGGADLSIGVNAVTVSGNYLYLGLAAAAGNDFRIYDVHNKSSPVSVGGVDVSSDVKAIAVFGHYAYIGLPTIAGTCSGTTVTGCELRIYDISNPNSPTAVGGIDTAIDVNSIVIQGKYLYLGLSSAAGNDFRIYDVTNPTIPASIGGVDAGITVRSVYVQGKYAYLGLNTVAGTCSGTTLTGCELSLYDISNPATPAAVSGVDITTDVLSVQVSGSYAFIGLTSAAGNDFRVYDFSVPGTPSSAGGIDLSTGVNSVHVNGKYAYLGLVSDGGSGKDVRIISIADPTSPSSVGGVDVSIGVNGVFASGKYLYTALASVSGNDFRIYDISGVDAPSASIGSIGAGTLSVSEDARFDSSIYVGGVLNVDDGIAVTGQMSNDYTLQTASSGFVFGARSIYKIGSGSVAATHSGQFIRVIDDTSLTGSSHIVRGLEVQAYSGSNNNGVNTGVISYGKTFGLYGVTTAQAGAVSQPAAVFADLDNGTDSTTKTLGNAIRAYTNDATSADLVSFYQETSAYTGNGLVMDFGNSSGSFSGNFINLKEGGTSRFTLADTGRMDILTPDADNAISLYLNTEESTATQTVFAIESDTTGNSQSADTVKAHFEADGKLFISLTGTQTTHAVCHTGAAKSNNDELVDCDPSAGADYAEMYPVANDVAVGDVVSLGNQLVNTYNQDAQGTADWDSVKGQINQLVKSSKAYQNTLIGVVSDNTADFSSTGYNIKSEDNPKPIALNGRVLVKVTSENGQIHAGDYVTSSTTVGKAMKATRPGMVIGQALADDNGTGLVMVFVHTSYYDPTIFIDEAGNISMQHGSSSTQLIAQTEDTAAYVVDQKGSGDILQLQQNGADRFLVQNNGSIQISTIAASEVDNLVVVKNGDAEVFSINARGDAQITGVLVVKDDNFAGSVQTLEDGLAEITFSYDLGTGKPVIQLTVEGENPIFAQVKEWKKDDLGRYTGVVIKTFTPSGQAVPGIVYYLVVAKEKDYETFGLNLDVLTYPSGSDASITSTSSGSTSSAGSAPTGGAVAGDTTTAPTTDATNPAVDSPITTTAPATGSTPVITPPVAPTTTPDITVAP